MATTGLIRGMGSFFKECEHPESRWSKCPHEYKIRYRNAAGRQAEESGFANQEQAKTRLVEIYHSRKNSPQSRRKAQRIQKYGVMPFSAYAAECLKSQRGHSPTTIRSIRRLSLYPRELTEAVHAAREQQQDGTWQRDCALRAGVEGTIRQATDTTGLRRARYRGLPKTHLDHTTAATALNLIRVNAWWNGHPLGRANHSHLARPRTPPHSLTVTNQPPRSLSPGELAAVECTSSPLRYGMVMTTLPRMCLLAKSATACGASAKG